jgi:hypothetical protein
MALAEGPMSSRLNVTCYTQGTGREIGCGEKVRRLRVPVGDASKAYVMQASSYASSRSILVKFISIALVKL